MAHFYSKLEGAVEDYKEVIPLLQKKELEEYLKMTRFERASCVFLGDTGVGFDFFFFFFFFSVFPFFLLSFLTLFFPGNHF